MFLCSLVEKLCTKEENDKTGCNFNFGHECNTFILKKLKKKNSLVLKVQSSLMCGPCA